MKNEKFEISDEELELVNGGYNLIGKIYGNPGDVVFKFAIGSSVEYVTAYIWRAFTKQCTVIDRKVDKYPGQEGYCAWYKVSCSWSRYNNKWFAEKEFEGGFTKVESYTDL